MSSTLPGRPHLAHLKKQAKQLIAAYRRGDAEAQQRFRSGWPASGNGRVPALHDAQSVVAREHGFASWGQMRDEVRLRGVLPHGQPAHVILVEAGSDAVKPSDRHLNCIRFAPGGEVLLSAGMDGRIREWRVADWTASRVLQAHPKSANTLSFHPDERLLTSGCSDGTASVWRWPELEKETELPAKLGAASWFAPLGDRLVTRALNGRIVLWSWPGLVRVGEVRAHPKKVTAHAFTADGEHIVTCGLEGSVAVTRLADAEIIETRSLGDAPLVNLGFMPDSGHLLVFIHQGGAHLLSWPDLQDVGSSGMARPGVYTLAFHPSEEVFAMCVERGVEVRRNANLELLTTLEIPAKGVYTVAFSPDDRWLAAAGADQRIRVWSTTS